MNTTNIENSLQAIFNEDQPIAIQLQAELERINKEIDQGSIQSYEDIYNLLEILKYLENRQKVVNELYQERSRRRGPGGFNLSNVPKSVENYNNYIKTLIIMYLDIHVNLMHTFGLGGIIGIHDFFKGGNKEENPNAQQNGNGSTFSNKPGTTPYPSVDPTHARESFKRNA